MVCIPWKVDGWITGYKGGKGEVGRIFGFIYHFKKMSSAECLLGTGHLLGKSSYPSPNHHG